MKEISENYIENYKEHYARGWKTLWMVLTKKHNLDIRMILTDSKCGKLPKKYLNIK